MADKPVTLAAIAGAHGVTGEVRLRLFGEGLGSLKPHTVFNGGALRLEALRDDGKGGAIARFAQIPDRNAAEAQRGTLLCVPRSALAPLGPGEYYHVDLIGLAAVSEAGQSLGVVVAVENFGAGDVIEIEAAPAALAPADGAGAAARPRRFMVPMRPEAVPHWDEAGLVVSDDFVED